MWVPLKRGSYAESSASPPPVGTPLYDRLRSQTQEQLVERNMAIGQIHTLPTVTPSPAPAASNSQGSSSGSTGSVPTTTTATPTAYPRPLPLLPSRSQSQLAPSLKRKSRAPSRAPSPSPRNTSTTAGPVPATGSVPLPRTASNPSHPLPPIPPGPTITTHSSSVTLATASSSAALTAASSFGPATPLSAEPDATPSSIPELDATSDRGALAGSTHSDSDLMNNRSTTREIPQVLVHEAAEPSASDGPTTGLSLEGTPHTLASTGSQTQSEVLSPSSMSTSQMQTAPDSPYLITPGQTSILPSPVVPPSLQSSGGVSPHPTVDGVSLHSIGGGFSPHSSTGLPNPSSPGGFAARFGKKKRQLSKDLLKRGGVSCEDLRIHVGGGEGGEGEFIRMIPQHHMQTMGLQQQQSPQQPKRHPELAQDRNWGTQQPSSPTHRPLKLNLGIANVFSSRSRKESTHGGSGRGGVLNLRRPSTPGTGTGFGFTAGGKDALDESAEDQNNNCGGSRKRGSGSTPGIGALFGSPSNKDKKPSPPSPPPKPAKLKAGGVLGSAFGLGMSVAGVVGRGSMMPNSPSIAAAIEYMRHEHDRDPRGGISARRTIGTSEGKSVDEHGRHSESASDIFGPSSSVASLLSSGTGTATSASEVVDPKVFGQPETYDADISNVNTPQPSNQLLDATTPEAAPPLFSGLNPFSGNPQARPQSPAMQDPDKRVSTASSQRTLMPWNTSKRESGIFVFPSSDLGAPLARVHTTDAVSPSAAGPVPLPDPNDEPASSEKPIPRPARLGQLSGSLKRRSASMSILLPRSGERSDSSTHEVPRPLPPRRILPTDGAVTDSEGYMSSASNAGYLSSASNSGLGDIGGRKRMQGGIKGKIAAWTTAAETSGRRKHHVRAGGSSVGHAHTDIEPRRSDSPHQHQIQGQG
ncbi:hypothetical protein FRC07_004490 [Ceratobasidium sp. 392]|nr:hypothetical protein FRC07_004490 [Ceratobasidium sp. 392]